MIQNHNYESDPEEEQIQGITPTQSEFTPNK